MEQIIYFFVFIFGLLIGSFLNVVIFRYDTGSSVAKGRSKCFTCDKMLHWYELLPLASFLFQAGRCRGCGSKISWQYPLVELATGFAFVLAYAKAPLEVLSPTGFIIFLLLAKLLSFYVVIAVYDLKHKIIPDLFSYSAALISLVFIGISYLSIGTVDFSQVIAGPLLFLFFFFFWFISKGKWMGLGDGKLALSVGWLLGLSQGIAAILLSFWIGAIVAILIMLFQKLVSQKGSLGMKSEIPFGPFILVGFLIVFIWGIDMQSIFSILAV